MKSGGGQAAAHGAPAAGAAARRRTAGQPLVKHTAGQPLVKHSHAASLVADVVGDEVVDGGQVAHVVSLFAGVGCNAVRRRCCPGTHMGVAIMPGGSDCKGRSWEGPTNCLVAWPTSYLVKPADCLGGPAACLSRRGGLRALRRGRGAGLLLLLLLLRGGRDRQRGARLRRVGRSARRGGAQTPRRGIEAAPSGAFGDPRV